jgi:muramoyltetrapeptide carboxypeptidase
VSSGRRASLATVAVALALGGAGCATAPPSRHPRSATASPAPVWPVRLRPGDTIMFAAPAGQLDHERMARARARLEARGYRVVERDDLYDAEGYLAGSDERRAAELMQAFADPEVDAIFTGTGGYGAMRILDRLDYELIRRNPKLLVGYSDITALHAALFERAGLVSFHSPLPMWTLGGELDAEEFSLTWFWRAVEEAPPGAACDYAIDVAVEAPQPVVMSRGKARGRLVGGNLSMVAALEGTPYAVRTRGRILLLEDVGEASYRVDRMLRQLELAGHLDGLAGVILGQFTRETAREDAPADPDPRYTTEGVLRQYFENRGIPVILNFPVGHHAMNATLPIGGQVEIDADADPPTVWIVESYDDGR